MLGNTLSDPGPLAREATSAYLLKNTPHEVKVAHHQEPTRVLNWDVVQDVGNERVG